MKSVVSTHLQVYKKNRNRFKAEVKVSLGISKTEKWEVNGPILTQPIVKSHGHSNLHCF